MAIEDTEHSMAGTRPRQPDKYHGQRDFLLLDNWMFSVDQYFILTDMPVHKQGPFVSTLLRDEALLWYRSSYEKWDPKTPLTWEIIRTAMREYFAPPNEDRRLQDEWANLRQHGTVFEYVSVLTALAMRIPGLSQTQILDKFIRGLKPKTRIEVELRDPKTPDEAYRLADRFDRIVYGVKSTSFLTQNYNRYYADIKCEHECGLRRTHADRHITTTPIRTEKLSATSHSRTLFHMQQAGTHRSKLPHDYARAIQEEPNREKDDVSRGRQLY